MAKGQHLTRHQQGIVRRYYDNRDTLMAQKLGEIVSDLFLAAGDEKKSAKLWDRARQALANTEAGDAKTLRIIESRDLQALARLVNELAGPGGKDGKGGAGPSRPARP